MSVTPQVFVRVYSHSATFHSHQSSRHYPAERTFFNYERMTV